MVRHLRSITFRLSLLLCAFALVQEATREAATGQSESQFFENLTASLPMSCAPFNDGLECYAQGTDLALYEILVRHGHSGSSLEGWMGFGGAMIGSPVCIYRQQTDWAIDCFFQGKDTTLWHTNSGITGQPPLESLGGGLTSNPACVAPAANRT